MKLAQALKQKNRLAGEITREQQILQRENARRNDSVSKVNRETVYKHILELSETLGTLKAKIAAANVGIYAMLERMAEKKSHIAFLHGLPKREDEEVQFIGRDQEKLTYKWDSFITQEKSDERVAAIEKEIAALQDQVDAYNAITDV